MKLILIVLLLISSGCYKQYKPSSFKIDEEFLPQVELFQSLYNIKVTVSISFVDKLNPTYVGMCNSWGANNPDNKISILISYWKTLDKYGKEQLLFHELGHCVLGREHDTTLIILNNRTNVPRSIMYPHAFGSYSVYPTNLIYYYKELINF